MNNLPKDIKYSIATHLSIADLKRFAQCNKNLCGILNHENFWNFKFLKDYPTMYANKPFHLTYNQYYKTLAFDKYILYKKVNNKSKKITGGVKRLVKGYNCILYIDLYDNLWFEPDKYSSGFKSSLLKNLDYKQKLLDNVQDVCQCGNGDLVLKTNKKLYLHGLVEIEFIADNIEMIGCRKYTAFYITSKNDLYVVHLQSCLSRLNLECIQVAQNIKTAVISKSIYYITLDGALYQLFITPKLDTCNSDNESYYYTHRRLIKSGIKDIGLSSSNQIVLLSGKSLYTYLYNTDKNTCSRGIWLNDKIVECATKSKIKYLNMDGSFVDIDNIYWSCNKDGNYKSLGRIFDVYYPNDKTCLEFILS